MKKLLIVVMACYALNARSQVNDPKDYLYLKTDSIVYAKKITLRTNFANSWEVRMNARQVPLAQIKFISNGDGFFAKTENADFFGDAKIAERFIEGRINVFKQIPKYAEDFGYYRFRSNSYRANVNSEKELYFNKGFGDLEKLTYQNLHSSLSDHSASLFILGGYKKNRTTSIIMYVAAGLSAITGIASMADAGSNRSFGSLPRVGPGFALIGIASGLGLGGYLIQSSGKKKFFEAIENYNR